MANTAISIEHVSKRYELGTISTGTFFRDVNRWWAKQRGKPDPYQKIGDADHGNRDGETVWALRDVDFQVSQGEALGIIGRNGAGKSTLLKILSRVTTPTSGEVKVKGRIASLLEVGTGFHQELTGRENIYLNGAILGMSKAEINRKLDEIIDFSGVEKYIDTPVKRYSSGMYVRLAFAVAAHLEPEILIVDEVLAVGDAEFQKKCLGKMGDVAHEGRTVLFVSHNMGAIRELCTRGILLQNGSVVDNNDVVTIISKYLNQNTIIDRGESIFVEKFGFYINEIKINGNLIEQIPEIISGDTINIQLDYSAKEQGMDLCIGYGLRSGKEGTLIVFTHNHLENAYTKTKTTGIVSTSLEVPFLSPGQYQLELSLWINNNYVLGEKSTGKFMIIPSPAFNSKVTFSSYPSLLLVGSVWLFSTND